MLDDIGESLLTRKLRKIIYVFDKRGMLPGAEIATDEQYKFSVQHETLTVHFNIQKVSDFDYVFSFSVVKTLLENVSDIIYTDLFVLHSFSMYGVIESSITYVIDKVGAMATLK